MPELFKDDVDDSAFEIPGDDQRLAAMREAGGEPDAPVEAAPAAEVETETPKATEIVEPPAATADAEAPAAAVELTADDPRVKAYLDKYDGDVEKALAAAVDAQVLVGRQGQELGELRRTVEERMGQVEQTVRAATTPQYDPDELAGWFAENPTRIPEVARTAFYQGNDALMDAAIEAWEDVDKLGARRFDRDVAVARARQEISAESEKRQEVAAGWNEAAGAFAEAHPDLDKYAPKMREIAPEYPTLMEILSTGNAEQRVEVLEFLYTKAAGHASETLSLVNKDIAREQAREADAAIKEAAVASAATANKAPETSVAKRIAEAWETADAPYTEGWNV